MPDPWGRLFEAARHHHLSEGETLFRRSDVVREMYLVRSGRILLRRALQDGGLLTLNAAGAGDLVAEASLFAERYHCDALADADTTLAVLSRRDVLARLKAHQAGDPPALAALERASHGLQVLRTRIEVMRLRRVADRLDAYLELYGAPDPGKWVRVADWIGVTPPALYRELARRRADDAAK